MEGEKKYAHNSGLASTSATTKIVMDEWTEMTVTPGQFSA